MAVTYVAGATANNGQSSGSTTAPFTIPASAQAGDTAIACIVQNSGVATFTPPAGWTSLSGPDVTANSIETQVWAKDLVAGDPGSTVTFTSSNGARLPGVMLVVRGSAAAQLSIVENGQGTTSTTITTPTITTTQDNCGIFTIVAMRSATTTAATASTPSGTTAAVTAATAFSASPNFGLATFYRTTPGPAGSYGGLSITASQSVTDNAYTISAVPASVAYSGSASLSGSGTLAVAGSPKPTQSVALSGSGTLSVQPGASFAGSGSGTLAASGVPAIAASASLTGSGALSVGVPTPVAFGGSGTLTASGTLGHVGGDVPLGGEGTLTCEGMAAVWHFTGPYILDYRPLELIGPGVGLIGYIPYGQSVWKDAAGQWHTKYGPSITDLDGAQVVYAGGRIYPVTDAERLDLIAGGYGDYLTLENV